MAKLIRTMYGDRTEGPKLKCSKTMAQQQFKDECDVNYILKCYQETGSWDGTMRPLTGSPMFGDFTNLPDYQEAQQIIIEGREAFESLPAALRKRFDNNPANLLQFLSDKDNYRECVELGLLPASVLDEPESVKARPLKVIPKDDQETAE